MVDVLVVVGSSVINSVVATVVVVVVLVVVVVVVVFLVRQAPLPFFFPFLVFFALFGLFLPGR